MTVHFVLTWNYLIYPLAAIGLLTVLFILYAMFGGWGGL